MARNMTRNEALELLNCSLTELALMLQTTTAALARWDEQRIPPLRQYQIMDLAAGKTPIGLRNRKKNVNQITKQTNI